MIYKEGYSFFITFDLLQKDPHTKARAGSITTDHGVIEIPGCRFLVVILAE